MTREEAIQEIKETADALDGYEGGTRMLHTALTTLAPAVRYEPPTVEEVGDNEMCWVWGHNGRCWEQHNGMHVRAWARNQWGGSNPIWLPHSAIPEGGAVIEPLPQYNAVRINGVAVGGRGTCGAPTEGGA